MAIYADGTTPYDISDNKSVLINRFVPPTFCLYFAFTGINFRGMLHHVFDVAYDENVIGPIRTRKCRSTNYYMLTIKVSVTKYGEKNSTIPDLRFSITCLLGLYVIIILRMRFGVNLPSTSWLNIKGLLARNRRDI